MIAFDPRKFSCSFNGVPLSGFGSGEFFKATRRKPIGALEELGADGEGAFVISGDQSYDVEITLKKASPSNTYLSQFARSITMGTPVVGALSARDGSSGAEFSGEDAMLVETPPFVREGGDKYGDNVWKFAVKAGVENQAGDAT